MKIWDVTISGHEGTKYHKGILLKDFEEFIDRLEKKLELYEMVLTSGYSLSLRNHEKRRLIKNLIEDVNVGKVVA